MAFQITISLVLGVEYHSLALDPRGLYELGALGLILCSVSVNITFSEKESTNLKLNFFK